MKSYEDVAGVGLSEYRKSFNVQCYCDAREFECIATGLTRMGIISTPVKASTVLNEIIRCMCRTMIINKQGVRHIQPSDAIKGLEDLGISVAQLGDRRGRAIVRHLQQESLVLEGHPGMDEGDLNSAIAELERMKSDREEPDLSVLGSVPDDVVKSDA